MKNRQKRKYKRWRWFRVTLEIVFMAAGILCSIMPYPYPLLVPIGIGTIRIISSAVAREKKAEEPPVPPPVVYCNGEKEPKRKRSSNTKSLEPPANKETTLNSAYSGGNQKKPKKTARAKSVGKKGVI